MYPLLWTFIFLGAAFFVAVLEVFLPSGGILGVIAAACLITSIVFSFQTDTLFASLYTFFVCLLIPVFIWGVLRLWPHTWIGRRLLLTPEEDPALVPNKILCSLQQLVGKQGIAKSKMLLGGLIEIDNCRYNAVSEADAVDAGELVRVIRIEGTSVIVRKINATSASLPDNLSPVDDPFAK